MNKGFTLIELIAVITILGLIIIVVAPAYSTISNNIKTSNYDSKKSTIKKQTLAYVEKYLKNAIYDGSNNNVMCFSVKYLIQSGIISSDSETEEYIENNVNGEKYSSEDTNDKSTKFIKIYYDNTIGSPTYLKLIALTDGDDNYTSKVCNINY